MGKPFSFKEERFFSEFYVTMEVIGREQALKRLEDKFGPETMKTCFQKADKLNSETRSKECRDCYFLDQYDYWNVLNRLHLKKEHIDNLKSKKGSWLDNWKHGRCPECGKYELEPYRITPMGDDGLRIIFRCRECDYHYFDTFKALYTTDRITGYVMWSNPN